LSHGRRDVLAANHLYRALYSEMYADPHRPVNSARFTFLDPRAQEFYVDWDRVADLVVAALRVEAGKNPYDRELSDLVGELSTRSEDFRGRWATHNVRFHDTGVKRFHHRVVGDLTLSYETMELSADAGLTLAVFTAELGSKSEEGLRLLGSWAATPEMAEAAEAAERA
jgi:MmyB-like transcription regulator ligand binding domain